MTEATPAQLVERLSASVSELLQVIDQTSDQSWTRAPAAGEWTPAEVCGHICELIPYWAAAADALAKAPGSSFGRETDDPDRVGAVRTGADQSRTEAAARLRQALISATPLVGTMPIHLWTNAGVSASRGPMTVREIIEMFIVGHVRGHVAQVKAALA